MDEMRYQLDLLTAINHRMGEQEKMYRLICESSANAFLYFSYEDNIVQCLGNWDSYFDFTVTEAKDIVRFFDLVEEKDMQPLREHLSIEKRGERTAVLEVCVSKNRRKIWYQFTTNVIYEEDGRPAEKIVTITDISAEKNKTEELLHLAYYDMDTGLYNRNYFISRLGDFLRNAQDDNVPVSVIFIDIDDFKKINDGLGLEVGEGLLWSFADCLREFEDEKVLLSHFTSDLFCMAVYDPFGTRRVDHICRSIKEKIRGGLVLPDGQKIIITVSIGVAEYPEAANNALELINCAEIVMFKAKASGKNVVKYFDTPIVNEFLQNVKIENKLKTAIYNHEFEMYFQPQFFTGTKKLRGVEALIRWFDNNGRGISPSVFIPIAERNGMIVPLGKWVIEESIRNFSEWKMQFDCRMVLSVNISAVQYKQADFVNSLLNTLQKYHVEPKEVELEITETILVEDFEEVIQKLHILRDHGLKISLDDFGTGYSSLAYLKGMPVDTLKVDKSFVDTIVSDDSTKIITGAIIHMVKKLGYETVAEGVEEKAQYDYLKSIGCDIIQGYFCGRPMPSEGIKELLREGF